MKTYTEQNDIENNFDLAEGSGNAFPTGRCLQGQWEQENCQEWAEEATINGDPAMITYLFENDECTSEDAGDYPWDSAHISKIEVAEKDEDGDFETF